MKFRVKIAGSDVTSEVTKFRVKVHPYPPGSKFAIRGVLYDSLTEALDAGRALLTNEVLEGRERDAGVLLRDRTWWYSTVTPDLIEPEIEQVDRTNGVMLTRRGLPRYAGTNHEKTPTPATVWIGIVRTISTTTGGK